MPTNTHLVHINPGSDGDATRWPSGAALNGMKQDSGLWLETLGKMWMEERGEARKGEDLQPSTHCMY